MQDEAEAEESRADAFAHVAAIRSALLPNQLFIQHIDEHFGLNGKPVELAKEHHRIAQTVVPSACGSCTGRFAT